jgi:general stress protein 26
VPEDKKAEIQAFINQRPPAVHAFMTTLKRDGSPYIRQVSTFIEGWTIYTVSRFTNLKMKHLRNNSRVTYMWVAPEAEYGAVNVWVQGDIEIVDDPAKVQEFLEHRAAATGRPIPTVQYDRLYLRLQPTFLRAEGFMGRQTPIFLHAEDMR